MWRTTTMISLAPTSTQWSESLKAGRAGNRRTRRSMWGDHGPINLAFGETKQLRIMDDSGVRTPTWFLLLNNLCKTSMVWTPKVDLSCVQWWTSRGAGGREWHERCHHRRSWDTGLGFHCKTAHMVRCGSSTTPPRKNTRDEDAIVAGMVVRWAGFHEETT
jgi:hypothetical protein